MQTVRQFIAALIREAGADLARQAEKMSDSQLTWSPVVNGNTGRNAANQIAECAFINRWGAEAFRNLAVPELDHVALGNAELAAGRQSVADLAAATEELAAAIEARTDEEMAGSLMDPFTKTETTWSSFAMVFYWNVIYHVGQICYIQTLYGDTSF